MFDFAISQNRKRRPTKRIYLSWAASFFAHFIVLVILVQFPHLLQGGTYRYGALPLIAKILNRESDEGSENWRTVAVLRDPSKMSMPSPATLKKYLYDWDKKEPGTVSVPIRWGDVEAADADIAPMPRNRQEPVKPDVPIQSGAAAGQDSGAENADAGEAASAAAPKKPDVEKKEAVPLPPPVPERKMDIASIVPPSKIPDSIPPPAPARSPKESIQVFEDEQNAIRSADSGFFDTEGFPLGEYTNLIVERIKGKWLIPSNLRNSRGRTTVVFYIDKDGRLMNARIVKALGANSLDRAALNAILESEPFPPLPEGFPGDHVGAKIIFSYNEPQ
jgi:TonB family protein